MRKLIFSLTIALVLCATFMALSPPSVGAQNATYYGRADALYHWIYSAFDDSLLNYGVRPRLNAKTWFNTKGTSATDTLQSWRRSNGNTEAFVDSLGNFTLRGITMGENLTGTTINTVSVARFISLMVGDPSTPQFTSNLDQDTGSYSLGSYMNRWGVATGGINRAIWDSTGSYFRGKIELRGNVIPNSDTLLVLRSSLGNTVASIDTSGTLFATSFLTPYAQTITVAKSGGDYTTISAAIAHAVTHTPSATNLFTVEIYPGVYTEAITMAAYVNIKGVGPRGSVVIFQNAATPVTLATNTEIENLTIRTGTTADLAVIIDGGVACTVKLTDISFESLYTGGSQWMGLYLTGAGSYRLNRMYCNNTAAAGGTGDQGFIYVASAAPSIWLTNSDITMVGGDVDSEPMKSIFYTTGAGAASYIYSSGNRFVGDTYSTVATCETNGSGSVIISSHDTVIDMGFDPYIAAGNTFTWDDLVGGTLDIISPIAGSDTALVIHGSLGNTVASIDTLGTVFAVKVDAAIDSADVAAGALSGTDLANDAITADKIEEEVVDSTHVKDGGIANSDLRNDAVDSTKTKDGSLSVSDIANGGNGFTLKEATDDSVAAWITRSDSSLFPDGKLSIAEIQQLATRLGELLLKAAAGDSTWAAMARADSSNITNGKLSVDDINQLTVRIGELQLKEATDDSVYAAINRATDIADSSNYASSSLAIGDVAGLGDRITEKMDKSAIDDSLEAKGVYPDSLSTGSLSVTGYAIFDTAPLFPPFLWEVKSTDFYTYADDSTTVSDLMDTTAVNTMQWFYKRVAGNASASQKVAILLATQIPSSVTPDSLIIKVRSNAATADSCSFQMLVKNQAGTILKNTGQVVPGAAVNTWQYFNYGGITAMTANQSCAYQFIIRTKYDATVDVSSMYFK